jgi:hypothetical protein
MVVTLFWLKSGEFLFRLVLELREVGGGERELMKLELWALLGLCFGEHFGKRVSILSAAWIRSSPAGQPEPLWEPAIVAHHQ